MRYLFMVFILALILAGCDAPLGERSGVAKVDSITLATPTHAIDTTPRVTGIGGVFFYSETPKKTSDWYGKHLGLAIDDYGSPFEFRSASHPNEINYLRWSPMDSTYLLPSKKEFMINYRVYNMEGLVRKLKAQGVTMLDTIQTYDYGKFVHLMDLDGNKIELWEPIDSVLTKLGGKTTK